MAQEKIPTIVIDMDGGLVHCVTADVPVRVIVVDQDIEGSSDRTITINGNEAIVSDYELTEISENEAGDVSDGVAPNYVRHIIEHVEAA